MRLHQRLCVPETFVKSEPVVERILNPTGQNYICNSLLTPSFFRLQFCSTVALSIPLKTLVKRSTCNISPQLNALPYECSNLPSSVLNADTITYNHKNFQTPSKKLQQGKKNMKLTRFLFSRRFEVIVTPLSSDKV